MSYNSKYTGKQVEEILDKANSSTNVTESTVANWGFTKNTGTYSKPSGGIPKTDLASAVQTSLNKADTALQSYTEKYKGTVTSVKINGATKTPDTNGMVDLGTIEGGSGGSSSGSSAYPLENHVGSINIISPNVFHVWNVPEGIDVYLDNAVEGVVNEYVFQFTYGSLTPPNPDGSYYTFPDTIQWANGEPKFELGKTYQISIVNNIGLIVSV